MKKWTCLLLPAIGLFAACEQKPKAPDHFTLTGTLSNMKDSTIYLRYRSGDSTRFDSAKVKGGVFTFQGKVSNPVEGFLFLPDYKGYTDIYLENGELSLKGNADSLTNATLTGSVTQEQSMALKKMTASIDNQVLELSKLMEKKYEAKPKDTAAIDSIEGLYKGLSDQKWDSARVFMRANPGSYVGLTQLSGNSYSRNYSDLAPLFEALDTAVQHSASGKRFAKELEKLKRISDGSPAIEFTKKDVAGKDVKLSDYKGKWVLLDFWASWCGPCRAENPNVLKNYNAFKDKGFNVLGVSLDDSAAAWKKAIADDKMPWTQLSSLKGWKDPVAEDYGITGIPANFLIDPQGIIRGRNLRGKELNAKLAEYIH